MNIEILMKDGIKRDFHSESRPGGSYTKTISYEIGFVIITDEYGKTISIPSDQIQEIKTWPDRY